MIPLGRPTLDKPKGYKIPKVSPRPANPDKAYMSKVIDLKDSSGSVVYRGTRLECVRYVKRREARRLREAGLM